MSRFTQTLLSTALTVGLLGSGLAYAKVSPEEAARLGQDLTPMGAEKAGNADGSLMMGRMAMTMKEAQVLLCRGPCLLYTSPSPRDGLLSRMPSSA